jgi:hypothetical protein
MTVSDRTFQRIGRVKEPQIILEDEARIARAAEAAERRRP